MFEDIKEREEYNENVVRIVFISPGTVYKNLNMEKKATSCCSFSSDLLHIAIPNHLSKCWNIVDNRVAKEYRQSLKFLNLL